MAISTKQGGWKRSKRENPFSQQTLIVPDKEPRNSAIKASILLIWNYKGDNYGRSIWAANLQVNNG